MHSRVGHVQFPYAPRMERQNPPTTGGSAAPDERVDTYLRDIEALRADAQIKTLSAGISVDERTINLGRYHATLELRARFIALFRTALPAPEIPDEPQEGELANA